MWNGIEWQLCRKIVIEFGKQSWHNQIKSKCIVDSKTIRVSVNVYQTLYYNILGEQNVFSELDAGHCRMTNRESWEGLSSTMFMREMEEKGYKTESTMLWWQERKVYVLIMM